jgi:hypothetical protein
MGRNANATEIVDRKGEAQAEVQLAEAQPLRTLRPIARVPAALRPVPHLLQRAGTVGDDPRRAQGKLVIGLRSSVVVTDDRRPTTYDHLIILHVPTDTRGKGKTA